MRCVCGWVSLLSLRILQKKCKWGTLSHTSFSNAKIASFLAAMSWRQLFASTELIAALQAAEASRREVDEYAFDEVRRMLKFWKASQRTCQATEEQRCWLCEDATSWNEVLHSFGYELWEKRPGVLCLRTLPRADDYNLFREARLAASIVTTLLKTHNCIAAVDVVYVEQHVGGPHRFDMQGGPHGCFRPFSVRLNSKVRHFRAAKNPLGYEDPCHLFDTRAVKCLKTLEFNGVDMPTEQVSELVATLRRNSATVEDVMIVATRMSQKDSDRLWLCLRRCVRLKSASLTYHIDDPKSVAAVVKLLNGCKSLEKVKIPELAKQGHVVQIAHALAKNTCVRDIYLNAPGLSLAPVLVALESNETLQHLHVLRYDVVGAKGAVLASMLSRNTGLRSLVLEGGCIATSGAEALADALRKNKTLESLYFQTSVGYGAIACLCKAFDVNKTLQRLKIEESSGPREQRAQLAAVLAQNKCYDRVGVPLLAADVSHLVSFLVDPATRLTELSLGNICDIAVDLLEDLCETIGSNTTVRTLKAVYRGHSPAKGDLLSEMLEVNTSITRLHLVIVPCSTTYHPAMYCLAARVAGALVRNVTVQELALLINGRLHRQTAQSFRRLLLWNETLTKMVITSPFYVPGKWLPPVLKAVEESKMLLEFRVSGSTLPGTATYPVYRTLRRNQSRLNRAIEFVQGIRNRRCARAFEFLCEKAHFLSRLAEATGQTEAEAQREIVSAKHYLSDNYLTVAGVVQYSVDCYPACCTQIDALSVECWRVITRYLKVSDVCYWHASQN